MVVVWCGGWCGGGVVVVVGGVVVGSVVVGGVVVGGVVVGGVVVGGMVWWWCGEVDGLRRLVGGWLLVLS